MSMGNSDHNRFCCVLGVRAAGRALFALTLLFTLVPGLVLADPLIPQNGYVNPMSWEKQRPEEARVKVERLRKFLKENNLDGYLITTCYNFSWLTAGADHDVILATRPSFVKLLVTPTELLLIAPDDESARVMLEEVDGLGYQLREYSNYTSERRILDPILRLGRFAADADWPGISEVIPLHDVRTPMLPSELERYRWLGKATVDALGEVAFQIAPGDSEQEIRNSVCAAMWKRGIFPTAVLIGSDERLRLYRHPTATRKRVQQTVMLNVCTRRWGLVVAVTRFVQFGPMTQSMEKDHAYVRQIQADVRAAMKPGSPQQMLFQTMLRSFGQTEAPDEWRKHSQGGPIGYLERDYLVGPETDTLIMPGQAQAWHPTYGIAKCEDTVFLHTDGALETITPSGIWPTVTVRSHDREYVVPTVLVRNLELARESKRMSASSEIQQRQRASHVLREQVSRRSAIPRCRTQQLPVEPIGSKDKP